MIAKAQTANEKEIRQEWNAELQEVMIVTEEIDLRKLV